MAGLDYIFFNYTGLLPMIQIFLVISIDFVFDQVATLAGPGVLGEVYMFAVCQCSL